MPPSTDVPNGARRLGKLRKALNFDEKLEICEKVLLGHMMHKEVAQVYHVSQGTVSCLIHKCKRKPKYLAELHEKMLDK